MTLAPSPRGLRALAASAIALLTAAQPSGLAAHTSENRLTPQEKQVVDLLKAIETGAAEPVAVINPDHYIQHNLGAADGLAGFGALLAALPEGSARVNTVRVFQDGDYVFAHTDYDFFGPKIGFDIFRFENGRIVEHWGVLQVVPETSANPNGMF